MAQVLLSKPSKLNNVGYILLGFYLASLIAVDQKFDITQQIAFTVAFGSFIGTLVYYTKPIENIIAFYFKIKKGNETYPSEPHEDFQSPVYKSEVVFSNFLQDDRTKISGAFFLAFGMITSYVYLESINLARLYLPLQVLTIIVLIVGFWEIYILIKRKMPVLVFFYNYLNISQNIGKLEQAIINKDWIRANKIIDQEPELLDPELFYRFAEPVEGLGVCINCHSIHKEGYCPECGDKIRMRCSNCKTVLVNDKNQKPPKYCDVCGEKID